MIEVDISDIFSKLRAKNDISNFFRENSNNKIFFIFVYYHSEILSERKIL